MATIHRTTMVPTKLELLRDWLPRQPWYRGAPLPGADEGLIGTSEHGVLGTRWFYDAAHDPVAVAQLLAFVRGEVAAQQQNQSDTADDSVGRRWASSESASSVAVVRVLQDLPAVDEAGPGHVTASWTRPDGAVVRGVVVVVR